MYKNVYNPLNDPTLLFEMRISPMRQVTFWTNPVNPDYPCFAVFEYLRDGNPLHFYTQYFSDFSEMEAFKRKYAPKDIFELGLMAVAVIDSPAPVRDPSPPPELPFGNTVNSAPIAIHPAQKQEPAMRKMTWQQKLVYFLLDKTGLLKELH